MIEEELHLYPLRYATTYCASADTPMAVLRALADQAETWLGYNDPEGMPTHFVIAATLAFSGEGFFEGFLTLEDTSSPAIPEQTDVQPTDLNEVFDGVLPASVINIHIEGDLVL